MCRKKRCIKYKYVVNMWRCIKSEHVVNMYKYVVNKKYVVNM